MGIEADQLERELEAVRRSWLADVRKVVRAPAGSPIAVLPPTIRHADSPDARPIQIVSDPHAPSYRLVDFDRTHPHRAKEVMSEIRKRLPADVMFNSFDLLCVRRVHGLDDRDEFVHKPKFDSPQYSPELVDWIVRQFGRDHRFFEKARLRYRQRDA